MSGPLILKPKGPYDLALSLHAASRFSPEPQEEGGLYRAALHMDGRPCVMEAKEHSRKPVTLAAAFRPAFDTERMRDIAGWILHTDLDLRPFYHLVRDHPVVGPMTRELRGLHAMRMPSIFIMAVTAITEQQISLAAAYRIRGRMIERYGDAVDGLWVFPSPERLARLSVEDLKACGLSTRKAEYIIGLSRRLAEGSLDLDLMKSMTDEEARSFAVSIRGLGPWAADYMLIRGLGRTDVVPADDLGLQKLIGFYLGNGERMTAAEVRKAMEPFAPYRGVAAFYLMVHYRK